MLMRNVGRFCLFVFVLVFLAAAQNPSDNIKYATDYNWSVAPGEDLRTPGAKSVNLAPCPIGVKGNEAEYWVYISGRGIPEAGKVTGGTCAGNGSGGTLEFTTTHTHSAGYTLGSASSGLQEASIAARIVPTNPIGRPQSGKVVAPPGDLKAYARVSIRAGNQTLDFSGSILECYMNDSCIFVGDPKDSTKYQGITIVNPRGRPMVVGGQKPFIEVNAQQTRILNVATRIAQAGAFFSSYVQVDDDQAFLLDGLDTTMGSGSGNYGVRCDSAICNPVVYAPGPFNRYSAVGWLKHLNISMQCRGNGIDWQSGNTVKISDSVIQGYAQYGVRAGTKRGGYGGFELDNVYEEVGRCTNPAGNIGQAGVIAQGSWVKIEGGEAPAGAIPQFANTGNTDYRYYVVARTPDGKGASNPLYAGRALTNGSGSITVTTPDITGAGSFDLLRVTGPTGGVLEQAPYGTGNYAVATRVSRPSACGNGVCTFTDNQAELSSYTVATPNYFPLLDFWPGNLLLGSNQDSGSVLAVAKAELDRIGGGIVALQGSAGSAASSTNCSAVSSWTPLWMTCVNQTYPPSVFYPQGALLMAVKPIYDGGKFPNLKGRLNFTTLGGAPGHIITLYDSNLQKTIATANNRPTNDAGDAYIGYDQMDSGAGIRYGISFGSPKSLSNYIGNVGDGTNWLERLTSTLKSFKVPISTNSQITSTVPTGAAPFSVSSTTPVANLTLSNHPKVQNCGTLPTCSAAVETGGQIVFGSVTLMDGTATVSGISPAFSSPTSFQCTASDKTIAVNSANAVPASGSSILVRGAGKDVISYICVGN